jgi:hypothetical protein
MAMTLRLTQAQDEVLTRLAAADGVSKQEAVLRAIAEAYARRSREDNVAELSARARTRYGVLIDRLGR